MLQAEIVGLCALVVPARAGLLHAQVIKLRSIAQDPELASRAGFQAWTDSLQICRAGTYPTRDILCCACELFSEPHLCPPGTQNGMQVWQGRSSRTFGAAECSLETFAWREEC